MNISVLAYDTLRYDVDRKHLHLTYDASIVFTDQATLDVYELTMLQGACWDGASIPSVFSWFLKSYDTGNSLYTWASLVHDFCYASECVEKDIADDFFRRHHERQRHQQTESIDS